MKHVFLIVCVLMALTGRAQNASLNEYTGKYNFAEGSPVAEGLVELKDDKLVISSTMGAASLTRLESDSFSVDEYGGYVAFRRNATKLVSGLKVYIPAANIDMEGVKADSATTTTPAKLTVNVQRSALHTSYPLNGKNGVQENINHLDGIITKYPDLALMLLDKRK